MRLDNPDLTTDPHAQRAVKDETVAVEFAATAGALASAVGLNHYAAGDALITGSTGDRWCVSRDRFDPKYDPVAPTRLGSAGLYRNRQVIVLVKAMDSAFSVARSAGGDVLQGNAGDWLVQYAPGDHGIIERTRFERVYRLLPSVLGIDHVQLAMPAGEEEKARAFYRDLLGLPEKTKPPDLARRGGCWFERGAVRIHLGVDNNFRAATKAHPGILVSDLQALAELCRVNGFQVLPDAPLEGFERAFVTDPFGNRIELLQKV